MPSYSPLILTRSDAGDGGWSLHPPDTTDEQIATGEVLPLLTGDDPAGPTHADYAEAWVRCLTRQAEAALAAALPPIGARVEAGDTEEDHDTGRVVAIEGDQVTVAWDSGTRTTQHFSLLRSGSSQ